MSMIAGPGGFSPIVRVPDEMFPMFFEYLDTIDLARAGRVCKKWYTLSTANQNLRIRLLFAKFVYSVIPIREVKESLQQFVLPSRGLLFERDVKDALVIQSARDPAGLTANQQMKQVVMHVQLHNLPGAKLCIEQLNLPLLGDYLFNVLAYTDGVISEEEEFVRLFIQSCIEAECQPQLFINLIDSIRNQAEKIELFKILATQFKHLINYPLLEELAAECLELNNQLRDLDLADDEQEASLQIEFYFKALLATHNLQNKKIKEAEAFLKSRIDFFLCNDGFISAFLHKLCELGRFDLVEHLIVANRKVNFHSDYSPPDLHPTYIKIRNGRSLNDLAVRFKKLDLESKCRVLLVLIEKDIEIENAIAIIKKIKGRLPACSLADFAVHLQKANKRLGMELAEMSLHKLLHLVDEFYGDPSSINYVFMVLENLVSAFPEMVMSFYANIESNAELMAHIKFHASSEVLEQFYTAAGLYHEARDRVTEMITKTLETRPRAINKDTYYADVFEAYFKSL